MCLILDANMVGKFLKKDPDLKPVQKWFRNKGKLAIDNKGKLYEEYKSGSRKMLTFMRNYRKQINWINKEEIKKQEKNLNKKELKSNDEHIILLALASKAELLVSDDKDLHSDFKSIIPKGAIYQNINHKKLLDKHSCP